MQIKEPKKAISSLSKSWRCHARVLEGVNSFESVSTFENHCLEGKFTFGDAFLDSGVVGWGRHRIAPSVSAATVRW